MSVQFVGLKEINGPLVVLDNVSNVGYEEMVELVLEDGSRIALDTVLELEILAPEEPGE